MTAMRSNMTADREAAGEPGRLDAEQVHEPRHAMIGRPGDHEIARGFAGPEIFGRMPA